MHVLSKRGIHYAVALVAIGALLLTVDLKGALAALHDITLLDLLVLIGISVALVLVSVVKWQAFLARLGIHATITHLSRLYLVGYFVNLLMPSSLGGDVVRSLYVGANVDKVKAVSATMLERYTGLVAMLVMASVAILFAPSVTGQIQLLTVAVAFGVGVGTCLVASGVLPRLLSRTRCPSEVISKIERLHDALCWGLADRSLLIKAGALSIVFHLLTVVNTVAVGMAVGWIDPPWKDLFVVVPLILLVGAVPVSPQGLGLQEGAFVYFLHSVGATTGQALAIALVLRAKSYLLALAGAFGWMGLPKPAAKAPQV
jgi:uncharacterized protein (TIRG00374 family)